VGAALALMSTSTPLLQRPLTPEEASVFGGSDRLSSASAFSLPTIDRPVNILVVGTKVLTTDLDKPPPPNQRYQALVNSFDGLADTLMLLRFNPVDHRMAVLSIPRDTQVVIDGRGEAKINEANALGGPALGAKTVSGLLGGVPIDRYVRVNVQGIEKLVDALGGVTVYVPKKMYYRDDSQHLYINLKPGRQHLNGDQALQFLRYRYDELGDIGRVQRQQALLRSLVEQSFRPGTLRRLPQVIDVVKGNVDTNLSVDELMGLCGFLSQVKRSQVQMLMLPGEFNGDGRDAPSYWLPHRDRVQVLMKEYFNPTQPGLIEPSTAELQPNRVRVAIQDSTNRPDLVKDLTTALLQSGYRDVELYDPWSEPLQITRIIAQQGDLAQAEAIRQKLGFGEVRIDSTGVLNSDITVQIGSDGLKRLPNSTSMKLNSASASPIEAAPSTSLQ
jgi:polyisoprenyl-teichoic acid--peptidoglycan teichoic acid transferase